MEFITRNSFSIWLLFLLLLFSYCDARKTMLQSKGSSLNRKRLKIRKRITMDDVSVMDSSNTQPYVSSPFSWPPFDSLPPENSPPYCIYPPATPSTSPTPIGPSPTPIGTSPTPIGPSPTPSGPSPITPISPNPPSVFAPSPPDSGFSPSPPESGLSPSPPQSGFSPSPPESGFSPSPPESGFSPSPPYYEPSPPAGKPPTTPTYTPSPPSIFVPSPPIFQPPVVFPPPAVPPPRSGGTGALWCVVKPSVPDPIIQEAMNYACASGADCSPIQASGQCYMPNNLLSHASFAFNSYWQRTKVAGGTCSFGGTAMLVTVDPSHEGCHFDYF